MCIRDSLIDIRLEFGLSITVEEDVPEVLLVSELSPDTMTLWDIKTEKSLDSSLAFSNDEDGLFGFKEIAKRLGLEVS